MLQKDFKIFSLFILLLLVGCESSWNRANVSALQTDLETLLSTQGIEISLQTCSMVGTTRTGYCRFTEESHMAEDIIQAFDLSMVPLENATIAFIDEELEAGCGSIPSILEGSEGRLYLISGRPQQLRLPNGSAFEYMLLLYNASIGQACVQVSYAYG